MLVAGRAFAGNPAAMGAAAAAVPAFKAAGAQATGASPLSVSSPAGTVAGDFLIMFVANNAGSSPTITDPSGWTAISSSIVNSAVMVKAYSRVATGSDAASLTIGGISPAGAAQMLSYTGATGTEGAVPGTNASVTTTPAYIATTTLGPDRVVLGLAACSGASTGTPGSGWTERADFQGVVSATVTVRCDEKVFPTAGATTTETMLISLGAQFAKLTFAIKP